jgi:hypothetical protein
VEQNTFPSETILVVRGHLSPIRRVLQKPFRGHPPSRVCQSWRELRHQRSCLVWKAMKNSRRSRSKHFCKWDSPQHQTRSKGMIGRRTRWECTWHRSHVRNVEYYRGVPCTTGLVLSIWNCYITTHITSRHLSKGRTLMFGSSFLFHSSDSTYMGHVKHSSSCLIVFIATSSLHSTDPLFRRSIEGSKKTND